MVEAIRWGLTLARCSQIRTVRSWKSLWSKTRHVNARVRPKKGAAHRALDRSLHPSANRSSDLFECQSCVFKMDAAMFTSWCGVQIDDGVDTVLGALDLG